jgi:hypothetical protein
VSDNIGILLNYFPGYFKTYTLMKDGNDMNKKVIGAIAASGCILIFLLNSCETSDGYSDYSTHSSYRPTTSTRTTTTSTYKSSPAADKNTYTTKKSYSTSTYNDSYNDGYDDIYDNEDYDYERYQHDSDYASGVDDAMEDAADDFGDDW